MQKKLPIMYLLLALFALALLFYFRGPVIVLLQGPGANLTQKEMLNGTYLYDCPTTRVMLERQVFNAVNDYRLSNGLRVVNWDGKLADVARWHSLDMAHMGYLEHVSPDGTDPVERMEAGGFENYSFYGENLAYHFDNFRAVCNLSKNSIDNITLAVMASWKASPTHNSLMLDNHTVTAGVGVAIADDGKWYVSEDFIGEKLPGGVAVRIVKNSEE